MNQTKYFNVTLAKHRRTHRQGQRLRVDSIVLALSSDWPKKYGPLSQGKRLCVGLSRLGREVNNGGYHLFFINSQSSTVQSSLKRFERFPVQISANYEDVISILEQRVRYSWKRPVVTETRNDKSTNIDECDERYFANDEPSRQALRMDPAERQHIQLSELIHNATPRVMNSVLENVRVLSLDICL